MICSPGETIESKWMRPAIPRTGSAMRVADAPDKLKGRAGGSDPEVGPVAHRRHIGGKGSSMPAGLTRFARAIRCESVHKTAMSEPAIPPEATIVRSPDQVSGDLDGKVVLLSIENGEYYNMNEVGSRIWALLEKPMTMTALIEQLLAEFEVERAACEQETLAFLEQLRKDKLLRVEAKGA